VALGGERPFWGKSVQGGEWNFSGKDWDPDASLYYFNARWYDPEIGRFITEDPARDELNWYTYCASNPLRYIDPTGLIIDEIEQAELQKLIDAGAPQEAIDGMTEFYDNNMAVAINTITIDPTKGTVNTLYNWAPENINAENPDENRSSDLGLMVKAKQNNQEIKIVVIAPEKNKPPLDFHFTFQTGLGLMGGCVGGGDIGGGVAISVSSVKGFQLGLYGYIGAGGYFGAGASASLDFTVSANHTIEAIRGITSTGGVTVGEGQGFGGSMSTAVGSYPFFTASYVFATAGTFVQGFWFANTAGVIVLIDTNKNKTSIGNIR
jgi:RHS repeat-associated protein